MQIETFEAENMEDLKSQVQKFLDEHKGIQVVDFSHSTVPGVILGTTADIELVTGVLLYN